MICVYCGKVDPAEPTMDRNKTKLLQKLFSLKKSDLYQIRRIMISNKR